MNFFILIVVLTYTSDFVVKEIFFLTECCGLVSVAHPKNRSAVLLIHSLSNGYLNSSSSSPETYSGII